MSKISENFKSAIFVKLIRKILQKFIESKLLFHANIWRIMADPFHVFGLNLVLFDYLLFALFSFVIGLIKSFVLTYIIRENVVRKK